MTNIQQLHSRIFWIEGLDKYDFLKNVILNSTVICPFLIFIALRFEQKSFSMLARNCAWKWLVEIGPVIQEEKVFKSCQVAISQLFPLGKEHGLHLNKLEFPLPKDALCQVWLKLAQWFWRRRILNVLNVFLLFRNYLPFEKGVALHLNKFEFSTQR